MQAQAIDMTAQDEAQPPSAEKPGGRAGGIGRKGKLLLLGAGGLAILGAGGYGALQYMGEGHAAEGKPATAADVGPDNFVDVPPMVVNLRSADGQARYLKLRFMAVAAGADKADRIRAQMPLILDAFQPFLRELRPEDLNGSAAVYRVKEEMMRRATDVLGPGLVRDILIQDLVQQ